MEKGAGLMMSRAHLIEWVLARHEGQTVRKTALPYAHHLLSVAAMVSDSFTRGFEMGLCHDLFEKTGTTEAELQNVLITFGYTAQETGAIVQAVNELTHRYTKAAFPKLKKAERKALETERLLQSSAETQTVKYADYAYNADWMIRYDKKRATVYLKEKIKQIKAMDRGNPGLRKHVLKMLRKYLKSAE